MKKILISILVLVLIINVGCQSKKSGKPNNQNKINPVPKTITRNMQVPKQLDVVESNAEDIISDINNKDWNKVQNRVSTIKSNIGELNTILKNDQVSTNLINGINLALTNLEQDTTSKNVYESKTKANLITKYVWDISDLYKTNYPTQIGKLDYIGREVILNAEKDMWVAAKDNAIIGRKLWETLKPRFNDTYKTETDKFNSSLSNLEKAITSKDKSLTIKNANILLDHVDALEIAYKKQNNIK